jgi:ATP-dependent helicase/DNAse subunit B
LPDVRALFVMGANEGSIPDYSATGDKFSEAERSLLLSGVAGLRHAGGMDKQKLAIVKALSRPRERLFLSCVADGNMQRSPVLDRIVDMLEGVKTNRMADITPVLAQNAFEITARCVRNAADGHADACDVPEVVAAVLSDGMGGEAEKIQKALETENRAESVGGLAGKLYGAYVPSATRIESFYGCPYRHFVRYGVRAAQAREYNIDRLDVGRFAHDVLDMAAKQVQGAGWDNVGGDELRKAVRDSAARVSETDPRYRLNARNQAVLGAVTDEIALAAEMIRRQSKKGTLRPARTEYEFCLDAPAVMGKVDRIDTAEEGGGRYFSIVDYKTGASDFDIDRMAEGLDLQLVIYVIAVRALMGDDYVFAGANYMRIFNALRERGEPLEPLFKMRGITGVPAEDARRLFGEDDRGGLFAVAARYKKDGGYDSASRQRSYTGEELDTLAGWAVRLIGQARARIEDGETSISPAEDGKHGLACASCEFGGICGFEAEMDTPRVIENEGKEARMARMRTALEKADETD